MTTDISGNVYFLGNGGSQFLAGSHLFSGYGKEDIVIASFSCDGKFRWSKVIGTTSDSDRAFSLRADGAGGIYLAGEMHLSNTHHIDTDTTVGPTTRTMYLIKWDTAGKFQWLRMPQPASIGYPAASLESKMIDMDVDEQGNMHVLAYLAPATYGGSYTVSARGMHVLRYAANGQFLGGMSIPITLSNGRGLYNLPFNTHLTYSAGTNRYIINGVGTANFQTFHPGVLSVGGTPIPFPAHFIASINATTGALSWLKHGTSIEVGFKGRAQADANGDIYVTGVADSLPALGVPVFNGVTMSEGPFAMKLNGSNGSPIWTLSGRSSTNPSSGEFSHAYVLGVAGNKVIIGGRFIDTVTFPTHKLTSTYITDSSQPFLLQLDAATGSIQQAVKLSGGNGAAITLIAPGKKNNFYVGGVMSLLPLTIGSTTLQNPPSHGGYFITKWGFNNCNCVLPAPSYTSSSLSGATARFTYTGTTGGIDSLVWEWGDGQRQKVTSGFTTPITHAYASSGKYTVCVTAYNDTCGQNRYCGQTALSVGPLAGASGIQVYPNPAADRITVEGAGAGTATITNALGQALIRSALTRGEETIPIGLLPAGIYLLRVQDERGGQETRRFVKQ